MLLIAKRFPASGLSSYATASGRALALATNDPKGASSKSALIRHVSRLAARPVKDLLKIWIGTCEWPEGALVLEQSNSVGSSC